MKKPEKTPLGWKTAHILEEEIRRGRWMDCLPGYRALSKELGVSPRVVTDALDILTRRKVLLPAEARRPRKINPDQSTVIPDDQQKSLTVLSATPYDQHNENTLRLLEKIHQRMSSVEWSVFMEVSKEYGAGEISKHLETLACQRRHHRWLLIGPSGDIVRWAMEKNLQIICLGGTVCDLPPPLICLRISSLLKSSFEKMVSLGHQKICLMTSLQTSNMFPHLTSFVSELFQKHHIPFHQPYNFPLLEEDTPQSFKDCLKSLFQLTPPTAIIAAESYFLPAIYSHCYRWGILIPEHLSLITLENSSNQHWFVPRPAHFEVALESFLNPICNWIENYPKLPCASRFVEPDFMAEGSVGPPP